MPSGVYPAAAGLRLQSDVEVRTVKLVCIK